MQTQERNKKNIISSVLREKLSTDKTRLPLAIALGISYSTLERWIFYEQDKFRNLDVVEAITELTGLTQDEMFRKEETETVTETELKENAESIYIHNR